MRTTCMNKQLTQCLRRSNMAAAETKKTESRQGAGGRRSGENGGDLSPREGDTKLDAGRPGRY
eukprot:2045527-Pyramimonas_sp.AAC.1